MSEFNWNTYKEQAMEFALYENPEYPVAALYEEMGELTGKFAKAIRGDRELDVVGARKEIGDILWNCAALFEEHGGEGEFNIPDLNEEYWDSYTDTPLHHMALSLFGNVSEGNFAAFFALLNYIARRLDTTLEECATGNIIKLTSRKERDVIKGDGDNR